MDGHGNFKRDCNLQNWHMAFGLGSGNGCRFDLWFVRQNDSGTDNKNRCMFLQYQLLRGKHCVVNAALNVSPADLAVKQRCGRIQNAYFVPFGPLGTDGTGNWHLFKQTEAVPSIQPPHFNSVDQSNPHRNADGYLPELVPQQRQDLWAIGHLESTRLLRYSRSIKTESNESTYESLPHRGLITQPSGPPTFI